MKLSNKGIKVILEFLQVNYFIEFTLQQLFCDIYSMKALSV